MKIKKQLDSLIKDFALEAYLSKPPRDKVEEFEPTIVDNPSFEEAKNLDNNGKWKDSADHYYTIFTTTNNPLEKAESYIQLAQTLINLVKYIKARGFLLENKDNVLANLSEPDKTFFEARVFEKLGWINDYLGETKEAISNFSRARDLLSEKANKDDSILRIYETSNHFLGRLYTILAWQANETDTDKDTEKAIERFNESIQIYEKLRSRGKKDDAAEGFQYAWLARVHIMQGYHTQTEKDLEKMKELFETTVQERPGSGVLGYYHLLLGRLKFEQNDLKSSRENFAESLRINTEVLNYPSSQADALLGMALCDYSLGEIEKSKEETQKALFLNPSLLYRGYV